MMTELFCTFMVLLLKGVIIKPFSFSHLVNCTFILSTGVFWSDTWEAWKCWQTYVRHRSSPSPWITETTSQSLLIQNLRPVPFSTFSSRGWTPSILTVFSSFWNPEILGSIFTDGKGKFQSFCKHLRLKFNNDKLSKIGQVIHSSIICKMRIIIILLIV